MPKRAVRYAMVDAFTDAPFKGNPAAVCLLEDEDGFGGALDGQWMQSVAAEFNISITAFLARAGYDADMHVADGGAAVAANSRFHIRWFTPVCEVELCGHGTLAAAHFLIASGLVECNVIEFMTKSGPITAKKVFGLKQPGTSNFPTEEAETKFSIELDFPVILVAGCNSAELPSIPETLNGASIINVQKTVPASDLIVELSSSEEVANIHPNYAELEKCAWRGVIITGLAPAGSGYDFFTRFFCPKYGVNEDPVCGSAHCALAPYWGKKLGKQILTAFMASPRSGTLYLQLDDAAQRVRIRGEAVTVMVGTLLI